MCLVYETKRTLGDFFINRLHALHVQRAGVLDHAICQGMNDASGPESLGEGRIRRVIFILRFVFGIQVVQVSKKLIKSVIAG